VTCICGSMAYLRAAGNGVVAEVIRESQHLHRGTPTWRAHQNGVISIWPPGVAPPPPPPTRDARQAATFGFRESTVRAQGVIFWFFVRRPQSKAKQLRR
jgi:hypothetical protein